jgi:hypothetical protein
LLLKTQPFCFQSPQLKRLSVLIQSETIALSGYKFFYITRQMILAVSVTEKIDFLGSVFSKLFLIFQLVGTVVTFELVLLDRGSRGDGEGLCQYFENMKVAYGGD